MMADRVFIEEERTRIIGFSEHAARQFPLCQDLKSQMQQPIVAAIEAARQRFVAE